MKVVLTLASLIGFLLGVFIVSNPKAAVQILNFLPHLIIFIINWIRLVWTIAAILAVAGGLTLGATYIARIPIPNTIGGVVLAAIITWPFTEVLGRLLQSLLDRMQS